MPRGQGSNRTFSLTQRIVDLFADGEWHASEEVVAKCGYLIPPEEAVRALQSMRKRMRPLTLTEQVDIGRRYLIRAAIRHCRYAEPTDGNHQERWSRFRILPEAREKNRNRGSHNRKSKLTEHDVLLIKRIWVEGDPQNKKDAAALRRSLALTFGTQPGNIWHIIHGNSWKHVAWPLPSGNPGEEQDKNPDPATVF